MNDNDSLVLKLKAGDRDTYNYIVEKYYDRLYAYAFTLSRNQVVAEDTLQEVFIKIWEKKSNLNSDMPIINYMYKMVYNEFINKYRKNKKTQETELEYFKNINKLVEIDTQSESNERSTILNREIELLPNKCKEIFTLSKRRGFSNDEISKHLKISVKAVEAQITKAYSTLRLKINKTKIKPTNNIEKHGY
ncbi:MAG: sigma-70 family RNA polymerase sigma factor [Flavobacteriaceae bacterium]|nr:sigma-70 family RNA polymerase sigma factor [Flavobacteriaceae bacterium]